MEIGDAQIRMHFARLRVRRTDFSKADFINWNSWDISKSAASDSSKRDVNKLVRDSIAKDDAYLDC